MGTYIKIASYKSASIRDIYNNNTIKYLGIY